MQKVLSIIVPTYNKETTLDKCLSSVLSHAWDDLLEVLVINDGSTDHSIDIANSYQRQFPEIVRVVDKKNGNYGSTINAALPLVKGKYVRILDADDWFDETEFGRYLFDLKGVDADLIVTHFMYNHVSGYMETQSYHQWEYGKIYDFEDVASDKLLLDKLFMHAVTYRSSILLENGYKQTEGVSYTDNEWVFYPMFYVKTVVFLNYLIYHYSVGVDGQTMTPDIFIRKAPETLDFAKKMILAYGNYVRRGVYEKNRRLYLLCRLKWFIFPLYKIYLVLHTKEEFNPSLVDDLDTVVKKADIELYKAMAHFSVGHVIHYHYISYWRKYRLRMPRWLVRHLMKKHTIGFPLN